MTPFRTRSPWLAATAAVAAVAISIFSHLPQARAAQVSSPAASPYAQSKPTNPPAPDSGAQSDTNSGNTPPAETPPTPPTPKVKPAQSKSADAQPAAASILDQRMQISDTHRVWHPTRRELGFSVVSSTLRSSPQFNINSDKLTAYLKSIAPYVRRAPQPARMVISTKTKYNPISTRSSSVPVPAKLLPATPGIVLDVAGSAKKIQQTVAQKPDTTHIVLIVHTTAPRDYSNKFQGINSRIAHFVTHFNAHEKGRTQTVRRAIALIDSHFVAPGDTFSVNKAVGERTAERGFGQGIVFVNGHLDKQLGGGMCQVATTLFNAVLLANLKVVERHQHVRTVPYVKPGQDATVYWGQKDFKFKNNTDAPVYISYKTTGSHAICDLFGKANPSVKVAIHDEYQKLGERHYKADLKRFETKDGQTQVNYEAKSAYKWTPALDYTM